MTAPEPALPATQSRGHRRAMKVPTAEMIAQERRCLEAKQAGKTYDEIAEAEGFAGGRSTARRFVVRAMGRINADDVVELRDLWHSRNEVALSKVWPAILNGDIGAVAAMLRIVERDAKLLGLDHADGLAERRLLMDERDTAELVGFVSAVLADLGHPVSDGEVARAFGRQLVASKTIDVVEHDPDLP